MELIERLAKDYTKGLESKIASLEEQLKEYQSRELSIRLDYLIDKKIAESASTLNNKIYQNITFGEQTAKRLIQLEGDIIKLQDIVSAGTDGNSNK